MGHGVVCRHHGVTEVEEARAAVECQTKALVCGAAVNLSLKRDEHEIRCFSPVSQLHLSFSLVPLMHRRISPLIHMSN